MADTKLLDEPARLAALRRYHVLDTPRDEAFDKITRLVRDILGVPNAAVSLIDDHRQWFKSSQGIPVAEMPREISFCTHAIRSREPMIVPDARLDDRLKNNPIVLSSQVLSYAGAPLCSPDGYVVGTLCAFDAVPRDFSPAQVRILETLASIVVDEMELRQVADCDHLTGVFTRRGIIARIETELARCERQATTGSLILLDIDHFKTINDRFGHGAGDGVLRTVAKAVNDASRKGQVLGRVGGEEFALLLPGVGEVEAIQAAERFRGIVAAAPIEIEDAPGVTASFGVASYSRHIRTAEQWLAAADAPLYEAKRNGRNCCRVAKPADLRLVDRERSAA